MPTDLPLLSLVIWTSIIGGLVVLALGSRNDNVARWLALLTAIVTFVLSIPLWTGFLTGTAEMQFVERMPWIEHFNIEYYVGIDGISLPLILLTTFMTVQVVIAGWEVIEYKVSQYMAAFL